MARHIHKPLPRPTNVTADMTLIEVHVARIADALINGRNVTCSCGRAGFIRQNGKGIRWEAARVTPTKDIERHDRQRPRGSEGNLT